MDDYHNFDVDVNSEEIETNSWFIDTVTDTLAAIEGHIKRHGDFQLYLEQNGRV